MSIDILLTLLGILGTMRFNNVAYGVQKLS